MKLARKMTISLVGSALLLAAVVYFVGPRETAKAAWEAGLPAFLTIGAILFALMCFQAAAWAALERRHGHRVAYRTLLSATIVAMAGNIITPASHMGGEPGKIIYAGRKTGIGYTELAGTVLLCKYIEAMSFVLFFAFGAIAALVGLRDVLFRPPNLFLGVAILAVAGVVLALGAALWVSLSRKWVLLSAVVAVVARLRIRPAFFEKLRERTLRMELQASGMFRAEGGAIGPAFCWYLLTHVAMFARPAVFFFLGWHIRLSVAQLGLIFLASQLMLAVQLMPSGIGTLDGGLMAVVAVAGMAITVPQCEAFLLCIRFWDAAVVVTGAVLAGHAGVGLFRGKETTP
jgi:uncharacterized protein (TIRG00374 family)